MEACEIKNRQNEIIKKGNKISQRKKFTVKAVN